MTPIRTAWRKASLNTVAHVARLDLGHLPTVARSGFGHT
jgi:hypothetical protein